MAKTRIAVSHDADMVQAVRDKLSEDDAWGDIVDTAIDQAKNGNSPARKFLTDLAVPPLDPVTAADLERIIRLRREAEQRLGIGDPIDDVADDPNWEKFDEDPGAYLEAARRSREGAM